MEAPESLIQHCIVQGHSAEQTDKLVEQFLTTGFCESCGCTWGERLPIGDPSTKVVTAEKPKKRSSTKVATKPQSSDDSQNKSAKSGQ